MQNECSVLRHAGRRVSWNRKAGIPGQLRDALVGLTRVIRAVRAAGGDVCGGDADIQSAGWTPMPNTYPFRAQQARLSRLHRPLRTAAVSVVEDTGSSESQPEACLAETSSYPPGRRCPGPSLRLAVSRVPVRTAAVLGDRFPDRRGRREHVRMARSSGVTGRASLPSQAEAAG